MVAITGALWAFETELQDLFYSYRRVPPQEAAYLPPSALKAIGEKAFGGKTVRGVSYPGRDKAARLSAWGEQNGKEYRYTAFVNPYTGELLHLQTGHNFFDGVIELHTNLMLGPTGKAIVDWATLIFLVMIITGIVLWWPRNKARRKSSFKIKWKASFKRTNYDLHNVLGFYASWVLLFIVITGLAWGFEWMSKSLYAIGSGGVPYKDWAAPKSDTTLSLSQTVDDAVYNKAVALYQKPYAALDVWYPEVAEDAYAVYIHPSAKTYFKDASYFFDRASGALLLNESWVAKNGGEKLRSLNYDIHIGKILGFPGQVLVFLAALIAASLPVTGFLMWWGKRKKNRRVFNSRPTVVNRMEPVTF